MPRMRTSEASYVFDRFRLSSDGTLLVRDGAVVPLAPKVLQTLRVLIERAGQVVKKADLIEAVWPNSFVEDTGLTRNISLLRQALDDDGQRFVVTVARIGYRFAASVKRVEGVAASVNREARGQREQLIVGRKKELHALRTALDSARTGRGQVALPQFIAMMAEVLLLGKQSAPAEAWLMRAVDVEHSHDDRYFSAEVHRLTGVCRAARGDEEGARAHLQTALDVSRSQGATLFELRAALTLVEQHVQDAPAALRSVLARFPEPEPVPEVSAALRILG